MQTKQDLDFIFLITRIALREDVCVFFCNFEFQISFSGNFRYATVFTLLVKYS